MVYLPYDFRIVYDVLCLVCFLPSLEKEPKIRAGTRILGSRERLNKLSHLKKTVIKSMDTIVKSVKCLKEHRITTEKIL